MLCRESKDFGQKWQWVRDLTDKLMLFSLMPLAPLSERTGCLGESSYWLQDADEEFDSGFIIMELLARSQFVNFICDVELFWCAQMSWLWPLISSFVREGCFQSSISFCSLTNRCKLPLDLKLKEIVGNDDNNQRLLVTTPIFFVLPWLQLSWEFFSSRRCSFGATTFWGYVLPLTLSSIMVLSGIRVEPKPVCLT